MAARYPWYILADTDEGFRKEQLLSANAVAFPSANGIPIEGWTHDMSDEALLDLLPFLLSDPAGPFGGSSPEGPPMLLYMAVEDKGRKRQ